jgi:hypothetical protein
MVTFLLSIKSLYPTAAEPHHPGFTRLATRAFPSIPARSSEKESLAFEKKYEEC